LDKIKILILIKILITINTQSGAHGIGKYCC